MGPRPLRVYILSPSAIGARYGCIFSLPFCDWCPLRVYILSPSAIGARHGYIFSPLARLVPPHLVLLEVLLLERLHQLDELLLASQWEERLRQEGVRRGSEGDL
eukprot:2517906-Pyramimonas_sp.AAC.1